MDRWIPEISYRQVVTTFQWDSTFQFLKRQSGEWWGKKKRDIVSESLNCVSYMYCAVCFWVLKKDSWGFASNPNWFFPFPQLCDKHSYDTKRFQGKLTSQVTALSKACKFPRPLFPPLQNWILFIRDIRCKFFDVSHFFSALHKQDSFHQSLKRLVLKTICSNIKPQEEKTCEGKNGWETFCDSTFWNVKTTILERPEAWFVAK